jgi:RND family efflux transporter MFP subunit
MRLLSLIALAAGLGAQTPETVAVRTGKVDRTLKLPAEILPFQRVSLTARVPGIVETVLVDRGSAVEQGSHLVTLSAPEMRAQIAEAEAVIQNREAEKAQAEARVAAAESTLTALRKAAETPGAVAANDLVQAAKTVEAAQAVSAAMDKSIRAAREVLRTRRELERYLTMEAPFAGVVTARHVHPGALAGPSSGPLLELEQVSRLRVVVAVPEPDAASIRTGVKVPFTVPAHPGRTFVGTVARVAQSLDAKTRTMPVELDISNPGGALAPGMYADVAWPVHAGQASLLVPATAVVTTTERTFVIRVAGGKAEWVTVARGARQEDSVEVRGALKAGDLVVKRATDEIRDGAALK